MSNNQDFYAKPVKWSEDLQEITLSTKFMSPSQIGSVIDFINEQKYIKVKVSLVKEMSKTSGQLARYYRSISRILSKSEVEISKKLLVILIGNLKNQF